MQDGQKGLQENGVAVDLHAEVLKARAPELRTKARTNNYMRSLINSAHQFMKSSSRNE